MKISVVMATYNGERFLREQLDSIRNQTRQADELIICDDGSTDGTVELVRKYIIDSLCLCIAILFAKNKIPRFSPMLS